MAQISPAPTHTVIIAENYQAPQNNNETIVITSNTGGRNRPQSNATTAGAIIFLSAGMNMALALGWTQFSFIVGGLHFCYSWFIGVIIGVILAIPLRLYISKKYIMAAAILLVLVGGIIFTSVPYNYDALLAARYINGIAVGLNTVPYLLHTSECAFDCNRGIIVSMDQYSISFGIGLQMIYASYWSVINFPIHRLHGIFDIIFAVIAAIMLIFFIESPIDQIRMGNEAGALETIARMPRPGGAIIETTAWLEKCKMYIREHESMSFESSIRHGIVPLVKMLFFRSVMLAFCYSLPLNFALQLSMLISSTTWAPTVAGCCRIIGSIVTIIIIDKLGRKLPSLIWIICIGGLLIGLGSIFGNISSIANSSSMTTASALYIVMQLFVGFFTPYTSVLLTEAFPLRVKGYMMDICVIAEQILQIILINTITTYVGDSLLAQGVIIVVVFLLMLISLPETRGTSLSEAQRRFRNILYIQLK